MYLIYRGGSSLVAPELFKFTIFTVRHPSSVLIYAKFEIRKL